MAVLNRLVRVLGVIFQPIRNVNAAVQLIVTIAGSSLIALGPFAFASHWTLQKAAFILLLLAVGLTLRAAYQIQADYEVMLGETRLQRAIAARVTLGNELLRRMKRMKGHERVPRDLANEVLSWGGETVTGIHALAPDLGSDLYEAHAVGPETLEREDQMRYASSMLESLRKLGRELQGD